MICLLKYFNFTHKKNLHIDQWKTSEIYYINIKLSYNESFWNHSELFSSSVCFFIKFQKVLGIEWNPYWRVDGAFKDYD